MKKLKEFTKPENQVYCYNHTVELEPNERFVVDDANNVGWVVVGYKNVAYRSNRTGCIFGCEPAALVVSKIIKQGKAGKLKLVWKREDMPKAAWEKFNALFPLMASFALYNKHLQECARDLVREYDRDPPDAAGRFINKNPYWRDMRDNAVRDRENRRFEARQRILQTQADWYKDDNMSGKFDALMSYTPTPEQGSIDARIKEARTLEADYKNLMNQIFSAHKYEDMRHEYQDALQMRRKLDQMVYDLSPYLPKNGLGLPVLAQHPGI